MVKRAFTMFELILVIVILGIICFFTFEMTMQIFKSYTQSKILNTLQAQTELTLDQVMKRLSYRIKGTAIAKKIGAPGSDPAYGTYLPLWDEHAISRGGYYILEFVPYSYEAFREGIYSGFADLDVSNPTDGLKTPGSNFTTKDAENMFIDLADNKINVKNNYDLGIFFISQFEEKDVGYYNGPSHDNIGIPRAKIKDNNTLDITYYTTTTNKKASEQYHLAHTAYTIAPDIDDGKVKVDETKGDFDLYLYHNYRPWLGQKFTDGDKALLAKHVTRFNFMQTDNFMVSVKLCMRASSENVGVDSTNFTICKSKVMY